MAKKKMILFICSGNTCRSFMAEYLMKKMLEENGIKNYNVMSAGIYCIAGMPPSDRAVKTLENRGIKKINHSTQLISNKLLKKASLVLTMTENQKEIILINMPEINKKVKSLKEFTGLYKQHHTDISDPFGGSLRTYKKCLTEIEDNLRIIIDKIKKGELG